MFYTSDLFLTLYTLTFSSFKNYTFFLITHYWATDI